VRSVVHGRKQAQTSVDEQKRIFICLVCVAPEALSWTAVVIDVGSSIWSIPEQCSGWDLYRLV